MLYFIKIIIIDLQTRWCIILDSLECLHKILNSFHIFKSEARFQFKREKQSAEHAILLLFFKET